MEKNTVAQTAATEEQIEAALDAWFAHEDEGIIDWVGTGSSYPTVEAQRRDLRPILTAVVEASQAASSPKERSSTMSLKEAAESYWEAEIKKQMGGIHEYAAEKLKVSYIESILLSSDPDRQEIIASFEEYFHTTIVG